MARAEGHAPSHEPLSSRRSSDDLPQRRHRGPLVGALAGAMLLGLAACGDEVAGPSNREVHLPGLKSRIDGTALDAKKLERFRAIGEGCTFTVKDFHGLYRRVAVQRSKLPFRLSPIQKDRATGLGTGKFLSATTRTNLGTIRVDCYVPGEMTLRDFADVIGATHETPRWRGVFEELFKAPAIPRAALRRPISPEAREFLYELVNIFPFRPVV